MSEADQNELLFVPLGGAGEIGMNLNLFAYGEPGDHDWLMVDLGVTFNDGSLPGVDLILPDPAFIEDQRDRLLAIVLTHAHEDHLGAVPYLWPRLRCPVYATPFTATILKRKLAEVDLLDEVEINIVPLNGRFSIGPFDLELITLTHSIPEPNGIALRTPLGTVLHTGDWKFDPDPVVGATADEDALRRLGDEGVLAIVCDSTNVFSAGDSGSEGDLLASLTEAIGECAGKVAVACFATNVARLETIAKAARANGRDVVTAGRSLRRIEAASRENGYLEDVSAFIDEGDVGFLPDDKTLIICTGSQGEPRAALARIAFQDHPNVTLGEGDTVIFSSRVIPGNEAAIGRLQNQLIRLGVDVVTWREKRVHVSGHPARDELARMYQLARPKIAVPVHGELRHMCAHADLAKECQVEQVVVAENGSVVRLALGEAGIVDHVPSGRLSLEGNRLVPIESEILKSRKRAMWNGFAVLTIVIDQEGTLVSRPKMTSTGLFESDHDPSRQMTLDEAEDAVDRLSRMEARDDDRAAEAVRLAVRRYFRDSLGKRAITTVHIVRIP